MWTKCCSNAGKKDKSVNNVHHIIPIIRTKPTNMIIHIGRNDAPSSTPREIQDKSLKLKSFIQRLIKNLLLKHLLARNFLEKMKLFWVDKRCSIIIKDNGLGYLLNDDRYDNPPGKTGHTQKNIEKYESYDEILNDLREKNINQPIIGQLNIISIRNKFHFLEFC